MLGHEITALPLAAGVGRFCQGIAAQYMQHRGHTVADALTELARLERRGDDLVEDDGRLRVCQAVF